MYHYLLAFLGALRYRFPSRHIYVVGVTGTKGKSSTIEILNVILEHAGLKTALASTIRFKIDNESRPNLYKMTMQGRFFLQRFLREAISKKCDLAIIEMTSEGVLQFRHKFIFLDALIFTNLQREHIESHGSYEKYFQAKFKLAKLLESSPKKDKIIVANKDDVSGEKFLSIEVKYRIPYSLEDAKPFSLRDGGTRLTIHNTGVSVPLRGTFNIYNTLAASALALRFGIGIEMIRKALERLPQIPGRVEYITVGQPFKVVVDYAHTPDSLKELYEAFADVPKICVLGNTGGGRDKWKRPEMGKIAEKYCKHVILTNEDPYDEDPRDIVEDMAKGMKKKPEIILDRREAIRKALSFASSIDVVLISGKGTDPYIMSADEEKIPWSDSMVVREELEKLNKPKKKK